MNIVPLARRPELAERIARLHGAEWSHLYRDWDEATALKEFISEKDEGTIPITFVALDEGRFLGSVSVVINDLPGWETLNPWVASFLVLEEERGKGIGARLLATAEEFIRKQGYHTAYLFTEHADGFFARHGWQPHARATTQTHPILIMQKEV